MKLSLVQSGMGRGSCWYQRMLPSVLNNASGWLTWLPGSRLRCWGLYWHIKLDATCPVHLSHLARVLCLPTLPLTRKIQDFPPSSNAPGKPHGTFIFWIFLGLSGGHFISEGFYSCFDHCSNPTGQAIYPGSLCISGRLLFQPGEGDISPWSHASNTEAGSPNLILVLTQNCQGSKWWTVSTAPPTGDFPPGTVFAQLDWLVVLWHFEVGDLIDIHSFCRCYWAPAVSDHCSSPADRATTRTHTVLAFIWHISR